MGRIKHDPTQCACCGQLEAERSTLCDDDCADACGRGARATPRLIRQALDGIELLIRPVHVNDPLPIRKGDPDYRTLLRIQKNLTEALGE